MSALPRKSEYDEKRCDPMHPLAFPGRTCYNRRMETVFHGGRHTGKSFSFFLQIVCFKQIVYILQTVDYREYGTQAIPETDTAGVCAVSDQSIVIGEIR